MKQTIKLLAGLAVSMLVASACADDDASSRLRGSGPNGAENTGEPGVDPNAPAAPPAPAPACTAKPASRSYADLGGGALASKRLDQAGGANHGRIKPFSVLSAEVTRILGTELRDPNRGGLFGVKKLRWFEEPVASAVSTASLHELFFDACEDHVRDPKNAAKYANGPSEASAADECTSLMKSAWNTIPTKDEVDGCTSFALRELESEKDPSARWAHVCAVVLSAAQFTTY